MSELATKVRIRIEYPIEQVTAPVMYHLITDFGLVPNVFEARIEAKTGGFLVLDLQGNPQDLERGTAWLRAQGLGITTLSA